MLKFRIFPIPVRLSLRLLPVMWLLFAGVGCYFNQYSNVENARQLRTGMSKEQVLKIMGDPDADLPASTENVWFYFAVSRWHDGQITEDECMPLVFADGKLIGWGNDFYSRYRLIEKNFYQPDNYRLE